jgi:hypothetical protein
MTVYFQNARWSVTEFGLESIAPQHAIYRIHRLTLLNIRNDAYKLYEWLMHVSDMIGIDIEAFIEAWLKAIDVHGHNLPAMNVETLSTSLRVARKKVAFLKNRPVREFGLEWGSDEYIEGRFSYMEACRP